MGCSAVLCSESASCDVSCSAVLVACELCGERGREGDSFSGEGGGEEGRSGLKGRSLPGASIERRSTSETGLERGEEEGAKW